MLLVQLCCLLPAFQVTSAAQPGTVQPIAQGAIQGATLVDVVAHHGEQLGRSITYTREIGEALAAVPVKALPASEGAAGSDALDALIQAVKTHGFRVRNLSEVGVIQILAASEHEAAFTGGAVSALEQRTLRVANRVHQEAATPQLACCDLYPAARTDLTIEISPTSDRQTNFLDLLHTYSEITGQTMLASSETRGLLQHQGVGLNDTVVVPRTEVQSFVEQILIESDFVMFPVRQREPRVFSISSLKTQMRNTVRGEAIHVAVDELPHYVEHPALLVTTVVSLPNVDVRQLSNSMRTMITDANTQQMLPAGNTNSMLLTGFPASIVGLVEMLQALDQAAAPTETVEVFRLQFADAQEAFGAVRSIFKRPTKTTDDGTVVPIGPSGPGFTLDGRTNSIIVYGTERELALVGGVLKVLDVENK